MFDQLSSVKFRDDLRAIWGTSRWHFKGKNDIASRTSAAENLISRFGVRDAKAAVGTNSGFPPWDRERASYIVVCESASTAPLPAPPSILPRFASILSRVGDADLWVRHDGMCSGCVRHKLRRARPAL
jgi:hypothetical protein